MADRVAYGFGKGRRIRKFLRAGCRKRPASNDTSIEKDGRWNRGWHRRTLGFTRDSWSILAGVEVRAPVARRGEGPFDYRGSHAGAGDRRECGYLHAGPRRPAEAVGKS